MDFYKVFLLFLVGLLGLVGAEDHGTSHVSLSRHDKKLDWKYGYKIKHGKHGHASGYSHPHGYGGFGDDA